MVAQNKWVLVLSELESSIPNLETIEDCKVLLNRFESIDEDYRDIEAPQFYRFMWKVALRSGKLTLANTYAKKFLEHLIDLKRVPQIKIFVSSLHEAGLLKKKSEEYLVILKILLGKEISGTQLESHNIELFLTHPDHWKKSSEFLKQYLLLEDNWSLSQWKLCYEYILLNHFDKEFFISLLEKTRELNKKKCEKKITELLKLKKVKFHTSNVQENKDIEITQQKLHLDYDQMAMDLLSGLKEPNNEEQTRVINSLKYISEKDLLVKGRELIVAFELLGMEQVVHELCNSLLSLQTDIKERASTYYVWAQALSNNGDYYQAIDLIDDLFQKEPLNKEERLAFLYLKAEACLKINKIKMAKELYLEIKIINPHYRMVGERLIAIEASK